MSQFLLSIIVPVYNEQENIEPLLKRLLPVIEKYQYELIFVNDGSRDDSAKIVTKHARENKRIKLVSFNRNFGHQMALSCGYNIAKGESVVSMDADLQDSPEVIGEMIEKWQAGALIVYAKRTKRQGENFFKIYTAKWFYKFINFLSDTPIPQHVGDFRLLDRIVVDFLKHLPEQARFLRGLVAWGGFPTAYIHVERDERHAGTTHYPLSKMVNLALDGITSFSTKPLRIATYFGFLTSLFSVVVIIYKMVEHVLFPQASWLPGWASLFFSIVFLGGVQLITIGIIGEYISKIYKEVQKRPQYLIKETVNL